MLENTPKNAETTHDHILIYVSTALAELEFDRMYFGSAIAFEIVQKCFFFYDQTLTLFSTVSKNLS